MRRHIQRGFVPQVATGLLFEFLVDSATEIINTARKALDVITNVGVIPPPSLPVVRRLSTVPGRHELVDFEESMIIEELGEVECSDRSAA